MDQNMDGVLRFHNHQAVNPQIPFGGQAVPAMFAMAVPVKEPPPAPPPPPMPAPAPQKEK